MYPGIPTISCLLDYEPSALGSLMAQGPTMVLKNTLSMAVYCERRIRARGPWGVASMEGDSLSSARSRSPRAGVDECAEVQSEAFFIRLSCPSRQWKCCSSDNSVPLVPPLNLTWSTKAACWLLITFNISCIHWKDDLITLLPFVRS